MSPENEGRGLKIDVTCTRTCFSSCAMRWRVSCARKKARMIDSFATSGTAGTPLSTSIVGTPSAPSQAAWCENDEDGHTHEHTRRTLTTQSTTCHCDHRWEGRHTHTRPAHSNTDLTNTGRHAWTNVRALTQHTRVHASHPHAVIKDIFKHRCARAPQILHGRLQLSLWINARACV